MAPRPEALWLVLTTEADVQKASALAEQLISRELAACVSFQAIQSCYRWEGRVEHANEVQLLIKTTAPGLNALLGAIEALHSYDTPEILHWQAQPSHAYGAWAAASINPDA
ncbi:divalent-cation tolerance protein CutA [Synechococcus sp. WH 8016]|jgi:periplasmic divalent cation tolerance protein|uniref:divalent-cation tolerance protein CutA n=1 Tax=Synechococcus sp. WH 8016 TaxID=166318 RepID=UPI00022D905B|nr:divalent-cation tolerance protein CutA [Synechococcus sp. WH 8016]EHA64222.1 CutA1 divalent ion tolerance protein [Synechococcus sp. WH 8016]